MQFSSQGAAAGVEVVTQSFTFGHGVSAFDLDGDGDLDLYTTDGPGRPNRLFRNDGGFQFHELTAPGADAAADSKAVLFVDYDNDGDPDLFITHYGTANSLFRNDGGLVFEDVTGFAGVGGGALHSSGAAWGDFDRDGLLDLHVSNRGLTLAGEPNQLYRNQGDGTFEEVAASLGLTDSRMSFQSVFTDYDRDGDPDIYVASDKFLGNQLFRNDGAYGFADVSAITRSDLAMDGMGVAVADANADGWPDIYITNTWLPGHRCLVSNGNGKFDESSSSMGVEVFEIGWGAVFGDFDLDADLDLFVVNEAPNNLFRNDLTDPWVDVTAAAGVAGSAISYGCAAADLDNDGDLDLYSANNWSICGLYRNDTVGAGHWLQVVPEGVVSNRDGIGARIEVEIGGVMQYREIRAGSSFLSQMGGRAVFGLGAATTIDVLRVRWPSGLVDIWSGVSVDQILSVVEGTTVTAAPPGDTIDTLRLEIAPNPFRHTVVIRANLREDAAATLRVFDVGGRLVDHVELGLQPAGPLRVTWGRAVPAGVYWVELRSAGLASPTGRLAARVVAAR